MNVKDELSKAMSVINRLRNEGYDVDALLSAPDDCDPEEFRYERAPAAKFWDELPTLANGLRAILDAGMIHILDKETLVMRNCKTKKFYVA